MECEYAPFDWQTMTANDHTVKLDNSSLYADGYDVDISKAIASYLGATLVIKQIAWDALIPALETNDIDCIITDMSYTAERAKSVDFSDAYYQSAIVGVVKTNSQYASATSVADLAGCKAISQLGTVEDGVIDQISNVTHVTAADTFGDAVLSLQAGDADVLLAEDPVAKCIVDVNSGLSVVQFTNGGFTGVDSSDLSGNIPVRKGDSVLQGQINGALATIPEATRELWMQEASERCSVTSDGSSSSAA
jgi:ABC-type amino acid transport substrate-binding protein